MSSTDICYILGPKSLLHTQLASSERSQRKLRRGIFVFMWNCELTTGHILCSLLTRERCPRFWPASLVYSLTWSGKTMHFWFQKWEPLCGAHPRSLHKPGWNLGCRKGVTNTITYVLFSYSSERKPSRPSLRSYLRPSKVAPTTLQSAFRSFPTTLKVSPATLQSYAYDPQIPLSGAHNNPFRTLAAYIVNCQRAEGGSRWRGSRYRRRTRPMI